MEQTRKDIRTEDFPRLSAGVARGARSALCYGSRRCPAVQGAKHVAPACLDRGVSVQFVAVFPGPWPVEGRVKK